MRTMHTARTRTAAAAGAAALALTGLSACGDTAGTEEGVDVEDVQQEGDNNDFIYDGPYDETFNEDMDQYEGETVTVSAEVNDVLSENAFTIAGTEDTSVEELLIVSAEGNADLAEDDPVEVTGVVHQAFESTTVEEDLGFTLEEELFADYDGEPYIEATTVDTNPESAVEDDGES